MIVRSLNMLFLKYVRPFYHYLHIGAYYNACYNFTFIQFTVVIIHLTCSLTFFYIFYEFIQIMIF